MQAQYLGELTLRDHGQFKDPYLVMMYPITLYTSAIRSQLGSYLQPYIRTRLKLKQT